MSPDVAVAAGLLCGDRAHPGRLRVEVACRRPAASRRPRTTCENQRVSLHRADGIVLRTQKLGEADRIITILTREQGRVRLVAKGVRRTTSKFGARLEP